jgi:hypothetical protein
MVASELVGSWTNDNASRRYEMVAAAFLQYGIHTWWCTAEDKLRRVVALVGLPLLFLPCLLLP